MNADDRKALIKDIVDVIDARVIAPMERRIDVRFKALEAKDAKRSGEHRVVTTQMLPQLASSIDDAHRGDMAGIGDAFNKLVHVVADMGDTVARIDANLQPRAVVKVTDDKGGTSVRPASLVAAESSVRTENAQQGIATTVLNTALETTKAKDNSAAAKTRATITMIAIIVQGVILGMYGAYQVIEHLAH